MFYSLFFGFSIYLRFSVYSLKAIRAKVWSARAESPLFNVKTYTKNLENLYCKMWDNFLKNDAPQHLIQW